MPKRRKAKTSKILCVPDDILYLILREYYKGAFIRIQGPRQHQLDKRRYQKTTAAMLVNQQFRDVSTAVMAEVADFHVRAHNYCHSECAIEGALDAEQKRDMYTLIPSGLAEQLRSLACNLDFAEQFAESWSADKYLLEGLKRLFVVDLVEEVQLAEKLDVIRRAQQTCESQAIAFDSCINVNAWRYCYDALLEDFWTGGRKLIFAYQGPRQGQLLSVAALPEYTYRAFYNEIRKILSLELPLLTPSWWNGGNYIEYGEQPYDIQHVARYIGTFTRVGSLTIEGRLTGKGLGPSYDTRSGMTEKEVVASLASRPVDK